MKTGIENARRSAIGYFPWQVLPPGFHERSSGKSFVVLMLPDSTWPGVPLDAIFLANLMMGGDKKHIFGKRQVVFAILFLLHTYRSALHDQFLIALVGAWSQPPPCPSVSCRCAPGDGKYTGIDRGYEGSRPEGSAHAILEMY